MSPGRSACVALVFFVAIRCALVSASEPLAVEAEQKIDFGRDIRPILSDRCFTCHGPDEAARKLTGDVRLDSFEGATVDLGNGRSPVVPGHASMSEMIRRLRSADPEDRMPPPESNLSVSDEEIALLVRWIDQGASYTRHWSFDPPTRPELPNTTDWCRNEIDRFVALRHIEAGVTPSAPADQETLARRVSFDLTGVPPTPDELDWFLADQRPDAYERFVDRLLASERYGERMATEWLDVARYADTHGYHHDNYRSQWPWRDWVINAFNDNLSYDRFITDQLAGDLHPDPTSEQVIATGFCRNHPMTDEGGAIDEEYLVEYAVDRVVTTSTAFLGLTMQCARCHDHKYDPISMEDFYGLTAFFNSISEKGLNDTTLGKQDNAFPPFVKAGTPEQSKRLAGLDQAIEEARAALGAPVEGLEESLRAAEHDLRDTHGVTWVEANVVSAVSEGGATLTVGNDGLILASGENPAKDVHAVRIETNATDLRLLHLHALTHETLANGRIGRSENGNAVLTGVEAVATSTADPSLTKIVQFDWVWSDFEQKNGDYDALNVLVADEEGWAVGGHHEDPSSRNLVLLAGEPFGYEGGTTVEVRLRYESIWANHALGNVRVRIGRASPSVRRVFPLVEGDWFLASFNGQNGRELFNNEHGPGDVSRLDPTQTFGPDTVGWAHRADLADGVAHAFTGANTAFYVARSVFTPVARELDLSLGSDDRLKVFLNGSEVYANDVQRGVAPDQDQVRVSLPAGESVLVVKVVNDAGPGGLYYRSSALLHDPTQLEALFLIGEDELTNDEWGEVRDSYLLQHSPVYAERRKTFDHLTNDRVELEAAIPNVMVMEELPEAKKTYVLERGAYDRPNLDRPVGRMVPTALGDFDDAWPRNRLGLARWLTSDENPLVARVAVNRYWQMIFGTGIVKTSEDFGLQSEWPSHPALLDWLAVEFRESGWDVKALLRLIVTSSTYRQQSGYRVDLAGVDPDDRLLARYPRRRLSAEMIRDGLLSMAGLLREEIGGPSVKPYQPAGLWRERAMLNSDTATFERDAGGALYRRGLYTFWKRSAPPPQMATFDAPEREYCVIRRGSTNTPLQALVLMNDETYLEVARGLAQRVATKSYLDDRQSGYNNRLRLAFRCVTGREPSGEEHAILMDTFDAFLDRYQESEEDARALLGYGELELLDEVRPAELAALTMTASVLLNIDEAVTQD